MPRSSVVTILLCMASLLPPTACRRSRSKTWVESLDDKEATSRSFALEQLRSQWEAGASIAVRRLLLTDPEPYVRLVAANTLASHPDAALAASLVEALRFEKDRYNRYNLARLLAENPSQLGTSRLDDAARQRDLPLVAGGVQYFLSRGDSVDDILIEAYRCCGTQKMLTVVERSANTKVRAAVLAIEAERRSAIAGAAARALTPSAKKRNQR